MNERHQEHPNDHTGKTSGLENLSAANRTDIPFRLLSTVVAWMPDGRREWGKAMLAELAQVTGSASRWSFAISCFRAALFPPGKLEWVSFNMITSILPILGVIALIIFALLRPEISGAGLAQAFMFYGIAILAIPSATFGNLLVLAGVAFVVAGHARGWRLWPKRAWLRSWGRLAVEMVFCLLNPILYLAVLVNSFALRPSGSEWWVKPLITAAWILLFAFWIARACGAAFNLQSRVARISVRVLLLASLACLMAFTVKDAWLLVNVETPAEMSTAQAKILLFLRLCPLYFIPALLLLDYLRSSFIAPTEGEGIEKPDRLARSFFLLPDHASRFVVALFVMGALVTFGLAAHRRSEGNVRKLVSAHRASIQTAAAQYGVNARLIASIVYVTHRDQLSPFREAIERLIISAWGFRSGPINNSPLNESLDISVGLTQIKPRTAQTASLLATGHTPDNLPDHLTDVYAFAEPAGDEWSEVAHKLVMDTPIPVPTGRREVAQMLMNSESNLRTCALILALYEKQWAATNPDWSIRARADILATLYQIGFARSKPHGAPRSNIFGNRVRQVCEQPWLAELFPKLP